MTEDRDGLASSHEEAQERILMLERTKREAELRVHMIYRHTGTFINLGPY